jgi:hypothetical protein
MKIIFIRKREEVIGGWRGLDKEELHNLSSSLNTVRMINSRGLNG